MNGWLQRAVPGFLHGFVSLKTWKHGERLSKTPGSRIWVCGRNLIRLLPGLFEVQSVKVKPPRKKSKIKAHNQAIIAAIPIHMFFMLPAAGTPPAKAVQPVSTALGRLCEPGIRPVKNALITNPCQGHLPANNSDDYVRYKF